MGKNISHGAKILTLLYHHPETIEIEQIKLLGCKFGLDEIQNWNLYQILNKAKKNEVILTPHGWKFTQSGQQYVSENINRFVGPKTEGDYYPIIKTKIENLLKAKSKKCHIEITANSFSDKLKNELLRTQGHREIIFYFVKKARPDLTGFIEGEYSSDFLIVEIKTKKIELGDVYQTREYAELFNAKYSLLISTKEIPAEIKGLSRATPNLLLSGYGYEKIVLAHYDNEKEDFVEWFEKNPFS